METQSDQAEQLLSRIILALNSKQKSVRIDENLLVTDIEWTKTDDYYHSESCGDVNGYILYEITCNLACKNPLVENEFITVSELSFLAKSPFSGMLEWEVWTGHEDEMRTERCTVEDLVQDHEPETFELI